MRFWDSSSVMPPIFEETASVTITDLLREDAEVAVWWGTWAEVSVAISRLVCEGKLDEEGKEKTRDALDLLAGIWSEMRPTGNLRLLAALLSKEHPLKAADALQLAAALVWCEGETEGREFVCLDGQLRRAAQREGLCVLPPEVEEGRN